MLLLHSPAPAQPSSRASPHWQELCDATSAAFALTTLLLAPDNTSVLPLSPELFSRGAAPAGSSSSSQWRRLREASSSPICEVLGLRQRRWLSASLAASSAALTVVGSGSVLAGNLGYQEGLLRLNCTGDDLACWPRAQVRAWCARGAACACTGDGATALRW